MKRKRYDRRNWRRVARGEQRTEHIPEGLIVDYLARQVTDPLDVPFGDKTIRILDSGYRWLRLHPYQGQPSTIMLDAEGKLVQLYVDIAESGGLDPDGLPWHYDLYLDVIADLDKKGQVRAVHIIDAQDLQAALDSLMVTQSQFDYAWNEAELVAATLRANRFPQLDILRAYHEAHPVEPVKTKAPKAKAVGKKATKKPAPAKVAASHKDKASKPTEAKSKRTAADQSAEKAAKSSKATSSASKSGAVKSTPASVQKSSTKKSEAQKSDLKKSSTKATAKSASKDIGKNASQSPAKAPKKAARTSKA